MPFITSETFGESENILDSAVGLVVKTRQGTQAMAEDVNGRKVIAAGTLFESGSELGVVLLDYDMTDDEKYPIAVVLEGRLKKSAVPTETQAKAAELAAAGIRLV